MKKSERDLIFWELIIAQIDFFSINDIIGLEPLNYMRQIIIKGPFNFARWDHAIHGNIFARHHSIKCSFYLEMEERVSFSANVCCFLLFRKVLFL